MSTRALAPLATTGPVGRLGQPSQRGSHAIRPDSARPLGSLRRSPNARVRTQVGAASAEYAAVTACGVGLAGVLIKLLTSDFGQQLLQRLIEFFMSMVGVG